MNTQILGLFCALALLVSDAGAARETVAGSAEGDQPDVMPLFADGFETPRIAPEGFRDCVGCPLMIDVPAGTFLMGNLASASETRERPLREVSVAAFAVGVLEVTWNEWQACAMESRCDGAAVEMAGGDAGFGAGNRPVLNVSWEDAQDFAGWVTQRSGKRYRLLTEAEWEYVARAGTTTSYTWGDGSPVPCAPATLDAASFAASACGPGPERVGSFGPNAFGLFDVHGNVFEWVQDCFNGSYLDAPVDGRAWLEGDCASRMIRSGAYSSPARSIRSAYRASLPLDTRDARVGIRVARD